MALQTYRHSFVYHGVAVQTPRHSFLYDIVAVQTFVDDEVAIVFIGRLYIGTQTNVA